MGKTLIYPAISANIWGCVYVRMSSADHYERNSFMSLACEFLLGRFVYFGIPSASIRWG